MTKTQPYSATRSGAPYQAVLAEAAKAGPGIIEGLVAAAKRVLLQREDAARSLWERQALSDARQLLNKHEAVLLERYPKILQTLLACGDNPAKQVLNPEKVQFEQLELMDEAQLNEGVELARAQQFVLLAVDRSLAKFDPLICAAAGLTTVVTRGNPLRPELFVQALQTLLNQMELPAAIRAQWMAPMSEALGKLLVTLYEKWNVQLRAQGVAPAPYVVRRTTDVLGDSGRGRANPPAEPANEGEGFSAQRPQVRPGKSSPVPPDESLLTLDKLRKLLSGELEGVDAPLQAESFSQRFAREFDTPFQDSEPAPSEFAATVPAAFEALREMQQVDQVMQRIGRRRVTGTPLAGDPSAGQATRDAMRRAANGLGQQLSLEVVTLMVDNIANDKRLLAPVQQLIRSMEPALLRLALRDPRFFSDRQHPARRLIDEITHRSLEFESVEAPGFESFLGDLYRALDALDQPTAGEEEPFKQVLDAVVPRLNEQARVRQAATEAAVAALRLAEQRHLLAQKVATEIGLRPELQELPPELSAFLQGPWAQVVAHARIADQNDLTDPDHYRELIDDLIWSAQPKLTRRNVVRLSRLVPQLLSRLRQGLELIQYPDAGTDAFFDLLMHLHQQAFRPVAVSPDAGGQQDDAVVPRPASVPVLEDHDHWMSPAEIGVSGFMPMASADAQATTQAAEMGELPMNQAWESGADAEPDASPVEMRVTLPVGSWVELKSGDRWIRTQLTWASPHETLFLFTSGFGTTQSMTRRSRDKMLAMGSLRLISGQRMVESALDAVAQTAMRNSLNVPLEAQ